MMNEPKQDFTGGVAVVTGAGAGIGAGLARRAGALGMKVVVADIDARAAATVAEEIRLAGGAASAIAVDVSRPAELDRLAAEVHETWGDVRLLINNAGIETMGYAWEISTERWEKTLDVNLHGVIHGVRAFAPRMLASGRPASIANLASVGAFGVMPTQTAYILTKHAVQSFTECLALEMRLTGKPIRVSSIIPGMVKTRIFDAVGAADEPPEAARHRATMKHMMETYGMELETACEIVFEGLLEGRFWIDTQPEMTRDIVEARVAFLRGRAAPDLTPTTRAILGLDG